MVCFLCDDSLLIPAQGQHCDACHSLHQGPQKASHCQQLLVLAGGTSSLKPASWCTRCLQGELVDTVFSVSHGEYQLALLNNMQHAEGGALSHASCLLRDMPGLGCPAFSSNTAN